MKMDNKLPEEPTSSPLDRFISQLLNPLTYVLFAACLLSFLLREYGDVLVILTVVIFNGLMGMIQEGKAAQAFERMGSFCRFLLPVCNPVISSSWKPARRFPQTCV